MNIDEMPAGRELDAMVAQAVMGWSGVTSDNGCRGIPPGNEIAGMRPYKTELVPAWSTDIAAAWEVVEHLSTASFAIIKSGTSYFAGTIPVAHSWECLNFESSADTPELAICRAALKAMREATT